MLVVNSSDLLRKPSLLSSNEVLFIEDGRKHQLKSVLLPYDLYQVVQEQIEMELYIRANAGALSQDSYQRFLDNEAVVEDLAK